tara:strand:+ start:357 stop:1028 length:672 start_codon:yes stop_codon:yes gene_type:complete
MRNTCKTETDFGMTSNIITQKNKINQILLYTMDKTIKINKLLANKKNPRIIKDSKFKKLVESIKEFPEMLTLRPIVVDEEMVILGGNMRYKASIEAGLKEVPVKIAKGLTEEQKNQFIIKDNVGFGEWDWDVLANEWENKELKDWGMDVWQPEEEVDYSVLNDIDLDEEITEMTKGVKNAICIEFESQDYEQAVEMIAMYRKAGAYVGGIILQHLLEKKPEIE